MADLYDILNSGIFDNYKPSRPTFSINTKGISSSVPNYDLMKLKGFGKALGKGTGIFSTAIPFYNNFAFPVAQDMYKAILGDTDSKILQKALEMANINNQQSTGTDSEQLPGELTTMPELDKKGDSDLLKNNVNNNKVSTSKQANIIANQVINNKSNESPLEGSVARVFNEDDINIINDYLNQLQTTRKPYEELLSNYINNFDTNLDDYRRARKFYTGLAGWSGNKALADLAQDYNPFTINANRLALAKQLYDNNIDMINTINELQGNIALAKEMDLPAEAAFGNKNLLTALSQAKKYATDLEKARIMDAMRRYGYDTSYNRAIEQQRLRNQGNADVANIYMGGVAPGVGLQPSVTTVQQQTYNPVAQRQAELDAALQRADRG